MGNVENLGSENNTITPKSPIDNAAERPALKPIGPFSRGNISSLKRDHPVIFKLVASLPKFFSRSKKAGVIILKEKGKHIIEFTMMATGKAKEVGSAHL